MSSLSLKYDFRVLLHMLWLTVLVALPEVFQVLYVDEVVTGLSHHLCWGQIHIFWDPVKKREKQKHTFV